MARARRKAPTRSHAPDEREGNRVLLTVAHPKGLRHGKGLERAAHGFLEKLKLRDVELSLSLIGDRAIRRLNRTWRQKDQPTDVLSFPGAELPRGTPGPRPLGDVVISLDTAVRQAKEHRHTLEEELTRYLAHGLLHLLGYDHEASPREERRMRLAEERLLGRPGML